MIEKTDGYNLVELTNKINEIVDYINSEDDRACMGITNNYEEKIIFTDEMIMDIINIENKRIEKRNISNLHYYRKKLKKKGYEIEK